MPGTPSTIARYQISDVIGEGGMGTLYRAWDPKLDRQLAIKVLRGSDAELHQRFSQEARSAARLRHKHVVTIFDVGEYDGQPFIAMEYIQGETLAQLVRRRAALPLARKLELMEELCDGLAYAHRANVVHRDIKPANLMVDSEGALKILDFGIARLGEIAGMTQAGALIGTLNYMSPEQVTGRPANRRSDIFAVGVVFYELLAYRQAFPGGLDSGLFHRILSEPPPPLDPADGIGPDVSRILYRALEKAPENRYDDLLTMGKDLRAARARLEALETPTETVSLASPGAAVPAPPTPAGGRRFIDRDELDRRRANQVQGYLDDARMQLRDGNYEAAVAACEQVLMLSPDEPTALDLLDHARAAIEAAQQDKWLSNAEEDLKRGELTAARYLIEKAAAVNPAAPRVSDLQRALDEAVRQREAARAREVAIKRAADRAVASLGNRSFNDAQAAAEEILRLAPGHAEGEALMTRALEGLRAQVLEADQRAKQDRIAAALAAVQIDLEARRFEPALDRLRDLEKTEGPVPAVVLAIQDAEASYAADQRARQIAQQVEDALAKASALLARSDRSGALSQVDAALALRPDHEAARQLRAKIQDAIRVEAKRVEEEMRARAREQAGAAALAKARELRSHHAALEVLTEALRLDPDRLELRRAIEARRAALAEEERAEAQRIEAEKQARAREQAIAAAIGKARDARSHEAAIAVLSDAQRLDPAHPELNRLIEARREAADRERAAKRRVDQIAEACRSIETCILRGELDQAQRELETAERTLDAGRDLDPLRRQLAKALASREGRRTPAPAPVTASASDATVAMQPGPPDSVSARPQRQSATSKTRYVWAAVAAAAVAALTIGGYLAFVRPPPTPAVEHASIEPAKPPVAPPSSPPAVVPSSEPPPAVAPPSPPADIEPKLAKYRDEARRAYAQGDRVGALAAASNGLVIDSQDAKTRQMLRDWWGKAQAELKRAHVDADAQGSVAKSSSDYKNGVAAEQDARRRASANNTVDALRAAWRGVDLFNTSADEARKAAAAAKPSPAPPPPGPTAPPLPVVPPPPSGGSLTATANPAPNAVPPAPSAAPIPTQPPGGVGASNAAAEEQERNAIRTTLQLYAKAYTDRDFGALKKIWPAAPTALEGAFSGLAKQDTSLRDESISLQGTKATAHCTVQVTVVAGVGRQRPTNRIDSRSFILQKQGTSWIITDVK